MPRPATSESIVIGVLTICCCFQVMSFTLCRGGGVVKQRFGTTDDEINAFPVSPLPSASAKGGSRPVCVLAAAGAFCGVQSHSIPLQVGRYEGAMNCDHLENDEAAKHAWECLLDVMNELYLNIEAPHDNDVGPSAPRHPQTSHCPSLMAMRWPSHCGVSACYIQSTVVFPPCAATLCLVIQSFFTRVSDVYACYLLCLYCVILTCSL